MSEREPSVGLIGIGAMGLALAEMLLAAGCRVIGPRRGRIESFEQAGGIVVEGVRDVARATDIVIVLLPNDATFAAVVDEMEPVLLPRHVVAGLSTHPVVRKEAAARVVHARDAAFVDGEISGTPAMMRAKKASLLLAGDDAPVERVRSVLAPICATVTDVGAIGNAVRLKLLTNFLVGVQTYAAAETLALGRRLGLDEGLVIDAIAPSAGGSLMFGLRGRMMAERRVPEGDMPSFVRYFDLLRDALDGVDFSDAPLLELIERSFRRAIAEGHGARDISAICDVIASPPIRA